MNEPDAQARASVSLARASDSTSRVSLSPFRLVLTLLGLLLLTTAALKIYGYSVDAVAQVGILADPTIAALVIQYELLMGLWLISGRWRAGAWLGAILTFTAFGGFSFYAGAIGQTSCGCGGPIALSPWVAFWVDFGIIILLANARPRLAGFWSVPAAERAMFLKLAGGVAICAGLLWVTTVLGYGSVSAALANLRGERLSVVPAMIDLGSAYQGESREARFELVNRTDQPIRIVGSKDDCSCSTISELPITIPAKESRSIAVKISFKGAPGLFSRRATLYEEDEGLKTVSLRVTGRTLKGPHEVESKPKSSRK